MSYMTDDPPASERNDVLAERELVLQAQQGDQLAFEALYERYYARISRYLIRLVGDNGARCELAQETFLSAWEALSGLRDPSRFASWLYRIATNEAYFIRHSRKNLTLHGTFWERR
jgi:RNA polymerase sigma-70 factor, ECF subfamily